MFCESHVEGLLEAEYVAVGVDPVELLLAEVCTYAPSPGWPGEGAPRLVPKVVDRSFWHRHDISCIKGYNRDTSLTFYFADSCLANIR
jgi:hypothetical protein